MQQSEKESDVESDSDSENDLEWDDDLERNADENCDGDNGELLLETSTRNTIRYSWFSGMTCFGNFFLCKLRTTNISLHECPYFLSKISFWFYCSFPPGIKCQDEPKFIVFHTVNPVFYVLL